jgi:hypothetical protein
MVAAEGRIIKPGHTECRARSRKKFQMVVIVRIFRSSCLCSSLLLSPFPACLVHLPAISPQLPCCAASLAISSKAFVSRGPVVPPTDATGAAGAGAAASGAEAATTTVLAAGAPEPLPSGTLVAPSMVVIALTGLEGSSWTLRRKLDVSCNNNQNDNNRGKQNNKPVKKRITPEGTIPTDCYPSHYYSPLPAVSPHPRCPQYAGIHR